MPTKEKTLTKLRISMFPNAFFLEDSVVFQAETEWREQRDARDIQGVARLIRNVRTDIRRCVNAHNMRLGNDARRALGLNEHDPIPDDVPLHQDEMPIPEDGRLHFVEYRYARAVPGCNYFVCQHHDCERVFNLENARRNNYLCPIHHRPLAQLAHLFVHNVCGTWVEITPETCRNPNCGATMRLHIEARNLRRSYWWCPDCRNRRGIPEYSIRLEDGSWHGGWKRRVYNWCPTCRSRIRAEARAQALEQFDEQNLDLESTMDDTGGLVRMGLVPARTALKPRAITTVDMPGADENTILDAWFGSGLDMNAIRAELPVFLQERFDGDERFRREILDAKRLERQSGRTRAVDPIDTVREELRDYVGAVSAGRMKLQDSDSDTADYLCHNYGLRLTYLDGLAVINATIGYLVGSSDPSQAQLQVFWMGGDRYAVLAERAETEGILFELVPDHVVRWLHSRPREGYRTRFRDEEDLRRYLVMPHVEQQGNLQSDPILDDITVLLHTMAHLLIRGSERYTGVSRDTLLEILFPRALAFVLYDASGSDLGMLQTTFEGNLQNWIMGARYDAANCPHDPICRNAETAACHACLYIAERCCNTYWNRCLDRRYLIQFDEHWPLGYWGHAL